MRIEPFKLERFFARHEFTARHLLSASDCEPMSLRELLDLAAPESLALWNQLRLSYTESQGHPLLRAEVARLYQSVSPDDILIAVPEEAIFLLMQSLLEPGDHAVVVTPAYQSLYQVALGSACAVTRLDLSLETQGWRLDLDQLERSLTRRTRRIRPRGGSVAFPVRTGTGPVEDFCQRILEERGVLIVPGSLFDYPGNHVRIGLGRRSFPQALAQL